MANGEPPKNSGPAAAKAEAAPLLDPPRLHKNGEPAPANSQPFDYRKYWGLKDEDYPVMVTRKYAVFLDKVGDLDWQTTEALDEEIRQKVKTKEISAVFNQAAILRSYRLEHLDANKRRNFLLMLGEGLARAFDFDTESAMQMFDKASEYATARNQEVARLWYLCATGLSTGLFAVLLCLGWGWRDAASAEFGEPGFSVGLCSCAGALGAFFSILTRVHRIPLDPSAGWQLHWLEGFGRILIGALGAAVALLAVKVGLALTVFGEKGHPGLFLVAFVAGFSEYFVKTLIKRVEMNATIKEQEAPHEGGSR